MFCKELSFLLSAKPANRASGAGRVLVKAAVGAAVVLASLSASAQANPYQRGPNPTVAALEASAGPYAVASSKITSPAGYGGGTVYYPSGTSDGSFGVVVFGPGFMNTELSNTWWGPRLASHGFVVILMNTNTIFDFPGPRSTQMLAALKDIVARSQTSGSPYFGKIDPNRRAVMGHSMGGGGTLEASLKDLTLKAALPMAPYDVNVTDYGQDVVPTMVITGEKDTTAPAAKMGKVFYASFSGSLDKAYMEIKGAGHTFPNNLGSDSYKPVLAKYAVSWLKRFVDEDTRYSPYLCGVPHVLDLVVNAAVISAYSEDCPY